MRPNKNPCRKDIKMSMVHTANPLAAFRSRSVFENERGNAIVGCYLSANDRQKVAKAFQAVALQVGKRRDMLAAEQQQPAFNELAERWHQHKIIVFVKDAGGEPITQHLGKNALSCPFDFDAERTLIRCPA